VTEGGRRRAQSWWIARCARPRCGAAPGRRAQCLEMRSIRQTARRRARTGRDSSAT
jgi:hypothetical protein